MKTLKKLLIFAAVAALPAFAQVTSFQTSLTSAITSQTQRVFTVASVGTNTLGIFAPNLANAGAGLAPSIQLYVDSELMDVTAVVGTTLTVRRGAAGTRAQTHNSGTLVIAGQPNVVFFSSYPYFGSCTTSQILSLPIVILVPDGLNVIENCVNVSAGVGTWAVTNDPGSLNAPDTYFVTAAYTNATTTFSTVTNMTFPVLAKVSTSIQCQIIWQGTAATTGPKYQFTGPASPTAVASNAISAVTSSTFTQTSATAFSTSMPNAGAITTATNFRDTVTLGLVNGANAGNVVLQAAANGAGTLTIQPGSFCVAQ
jgi:hypothetical protein